MRHTTFALTAAMLLLGAIAAASSVPPDPTPEERDRPLVLRDALPEVVTLEASQLYVDSVDVVSEAVVIAVSRAIAAHEQLLAVSDAALRPSMVDPELLLASLPRSHPNRLHVTSGDLSYGWDPGSRVLIG